MRIRLRVRTDGEVKSDGTQGWFDRLLDSIFGSTAAASEKESPQIEKRPIDKRWSTRGDAKYFFDGRHCRNTDGAWNSEYVFTVYAAEEFQQIRVVMPEVAVTAWERQHDQRMSEEDRLRLARETMETLVDLGRYPAAITIASDTIAAAPIAQC
ncbi:MAG: hypothetical protein EXQ57_10300 [Bryobacterales bacterium]|nr:hypothetical protein [Bryobacterales bacterium]